MKNSQPRLALSVLRLLAHRNEPRRNHALPDERDGLLVRHYFT